MDKIIDAILPYAIRVYHKMEKITKKEQKVQDAFIKNLTIVKRKSNKPIVVAMIGLIGSGKSLVAQEIAKYIGGTVIEGDAIRVGLRKEGERLEGARRIAENAAIDVLKAGGNVVLDSDFVDSKKRASIREKVKKFGAVIVFVRTYCNTDIVIDRIINAKFYNSSDDFFGGSETHHAVSRKNKGAAVKIREMWRRTPHHYRWIKNGGGRWMLKKLNIVNLFEIDTSDKEGLGVPVLYQWKQDIKDCAKKITAL